MRLRRELGRRGDMSASELVAILLVSVAAIVIIVLFIGIRKNVDNSVDGVCAAQVRAASITNAAFQRDVPYEITACQTKYVLITRKSLPAKWEDADLAVKKRLAENMRVCWDQWGRGELQLFDQSNQYCTFCSDIAFDDDVVQLYADNSDGKIKGFTTYLEKTKTPTGVSYDEYFSGTSTNFDAPPSMDQNSYNLLVEKNKTLTIIFSYEKIHTSSSWFQSYWNWRTGKELTASQALGKVPQTFVETVATIAGAQAVGTVGIAAREALWVSGNAQLVGAVPGATSGMANILARDIMKTGVKDAAKAAGSTVGQAVGAIRALVAYTPVSGATALLYARMRQEEQYGTLSAIYITRRDPDAPYVADCKEMGSPSRSP